MKQREGTLIKQKAKVILPWLWLAAAYLMDVWFVLVPGSHLLDSDMASEMILSDLLNQEGRFISRIWYYSTEIRVASVQWIYRFTLLLFPNNWHLARTLGMAIMLAMFAGLMLLFAKSIGLGRWSVWMTGALLWPFGRNYLVYAIYGGHYLVYTFLYVLTLTAVLFGIQPDRKHRTAYYIFGSVVALISGMNGIKTVMVFQAPFLLAAAVVLILALNVCEKTDWRSALEACRQEVRLMIGALATTVAGLAGYVINSKVLAKLYDFKSFDSVTWNRSDDWFTLDRVLMDFFHEFGYQNGVGVFHLSGIASGIGLLMGVWMAFCIVRLVLRYRKLTMQERTMVLLLIAMLAVCGMAYTYFGNYCVYFWLTCMPVAIAVMAIEVRTEELHLPGARTMLVLVLSGAFTFCAVNNVRQEEEHPTLARPGLVDVANWLADNGYTEGYATFWNSNVLTEYTSGKVWTWTLYDVDGIGLPQWLQKKSNETTDPEHPFLLVDTATDYHGDDPALVKYGDCTEVYNDGRYVVYAFDSAAQVHEAVDRAAAAKEP